MLKTRMETRSRMWQTPPAHLYCIRFLKSWIRSRAFASDSLWTTRQCRPFRLWLSFCMFLSWALWARNRTKRTSERGCLWSVCRIVCPLVHCSFHQILWKEIIIFSYLINIKNFKNYRKILKSYWAKKV